MRIDAYSAVDEGIDADDVPLVVALAACHQGQSKLGVDHSWMTLLTDPLLAHATFVDFRDQRKFERCPVRGSALMSRNVDVALEVAKERHQRDAPLLCLGGDHTISIGTFMSTRKQHPGTRLVWIDAHPDINTPCSTLSGNCHGMPVAHLFNYVDGFRVDHPLQPQEILYIGLRSIDQAEQVRLDKLKAGGALIYSSDDIISRGIDSVLAEVDAAWSPHMNRITGCFDFPIHTSLDVDSMDPTFTPATGTPVHGGITPDDVKAILEWTNRRAHGGMSHLDIVEINCYLSTPSGAARTVSNSSGILQRWLATHPVLRKAKGETDPEDVVAGCPEDVVAGCNRKRPRGDLGSHQAESIVSSDSNHSLQALAADLSQ